MLRFPVIDVAIDPSDAMRRIAIGGSAFAALLTLLVLFVIGSFLQLPAVRHVELAMSNGPQVPDVSAYHVWSTAFSVGQFSQWLLGYLFVVAGLGLGAGIATIAATLSGDGPRYARYFTAIATIAVPCIGLYSITGGVVTALVGPNAYASYDDLLRAIPSLLTVLPLFKNEFIRGALASINPFALWAFALYRIMMTRIAGASAGAANATALVLLLAGSVAQGVLSAVSV